MCLYIYDIRLIRIGDAIFEAPGVTIGNPYGKIALAAVSAFRDFEKVTHPQGSDGRELEQRFSIAKLETPKTHVFNRTLWQPVNYERAGALFLRRARWR